MHSKKLVTGAVVLAFAVSACGSSSSTSSSSSSAAATSTTAGPVALTAVKTASDLRTDLNILLGEHIILASKATGAALAGNTDEFTQYGKQLGTNGTDIGALIGAAYGDAAKDQFNSIWSAHDGFFVDYTTATGKADKDGQAKAVTNLTTVYVPQFSKFIADATGLPLATVTDLVTQHVLQTKAIVDAQQAKDYTAVYKNINTAYAHMKMIGDAVSEATATKFADKFPGNAADKATDLRVTLNQGLQAHLYLASFATDAALAGRTAEFTAAGAALNTNGTDLGTAIGSVYGADAQAQFNSIWSAHNGFFVDYTTAAGKADKDAEAKAVSNLTGVYVPQFSKFISDATALPLDTVTDLVTQHVLKTKQIVDDQVAKNWTAAAMDDRNGAHHMQMIGDPLASSIVKKFPAKFGA